VIGGFAVTQASISAATPASPRLHRRALRTRRSSTSCFRREQCALGEYVSRQTFDPATLGFSPTALRVMGGYQYLPLLHVGNFSTTNANSTIASLGSQRQIGARDSIDRCLTISRRRR